MIEMKKKINSICRRLEKISKELKEMDLVIHVNGCCEILTSYDSINGRGEIVATAYTNNWYGGDS